MPAPARRPDKYALYEASVQDPDWDLDNMAKLYRKRNGREARLLREDFCATAALATAWTLRHPDNRAIGVDFDPAPLQWARHRRLPFVPEAKDRLTLVQGDVRVARKPLVDIACGLNFSWWIFRERKDLLAYLKASRASLRPGGMLLLNSFGGTDAEKALVEKTRKPASTTPDGERIPAFTYVWEHAHVNAANRNMLAYIHFELGGGRSMKKAFEYDWRLWTLPEVRDVALEAGFSDFEVWSERDGKVRLGKMIDNDDCWFANLVAYR